jgi:glycosyltransferase involved in cell wall biosynthesis
MPYYAAADVYLRPNLLEGDNLSSYAAIAGGLPIVGFASGAPIDHVRDAELGILVESGNSRQLATAIAELLATPARQHALRMRCLPYAAKHLDLNVYLEDLMATYATLRQGAARS